MSDGDTGRRRSGGKITAVVEHNGLGARRHRPDWAVLVIAALLAGLAAVIVWDTQRLAVAAAYARVGPAAFPYTVAAGLVGLALWTAIAGWRGAFPRRGRVELGPVAWIVAGLVGQLVLLPYAGFSIATGVLFAFTAKGLGRGPLWLTVPGGAVFGFLVWLTFTKLLQLSLPAGPLERLVS
jgi:putative tricarboxylic transport membrane protein